MVGVTEDSSVGPVPSSARGCRLKVMPDERAESHGSLAASIQSDRVGGGYLMPNRSIR